MARKVTTVLSLRDNYTAVIKKARRYASAFDKDVQKMTARLDKVSAKKHDIKVKNSAAMKALIALEKKVAPMRNVMVKLAAHVQHFKNQIKPVTDTFKRIATKARTITLKVKDGVSAVLTKINTALKKVGKGIAIGAATVVGAGAYAIKKGMDLEGYNVSMQHFVGVNSPNASSAQVQKQTEQYLGWLLHLIPACVLRMISSNLPQMIPLPPGISITVEHPHCWERLRNSHLQNMHNHLSRRPLRVN